MDYKIEIDPVTYTIADPDAYSTIMENVSYAQNKGLKAIGICFHSDTYLVGNAFTNSNLKKVEILKNIPRSINKIKIYHSLNSTMRSFNRIDLDIQPNLFSLVDYSIVSYIPSTITIIPSYEILTNTFLMLLEHNDVKIVGGLINKNNVVNLEKICEKAKEKNKIILLNNHSLDFEDNNTYKELKNLAKLCMTHKNDIIISSGSKICSDVGNFDKILSLLDSINFPKELIINSNIQLFENKVVNK